MSEQILKQVTFIMACRDFFGMKQGQTLQEFATEVKQLTPEDRKDMIEMFKTVGYDASKVS